MVGWEDMKEKVLEYIRKNETASYAELERYFDRCGYDWQGALEWYSEENPNVVFWSGWNEEAFTILTELQEEGKIENAPCSTLVYLIDGRMLTLPVVRQARQYKTLHWLPVVYQVRKGKASGGQSV